MRIRTRSYAVAFVASVGVAVIQQRQQQQLPEHASSSSTVVVEAFRSTNSPLIMSPRAKISIYKERYYSSSPCSASRADTDRETELSQQPKETYRVQRKANGAPVVDSTLLRFISQQKQISDVFRETSTRPEGTNNANNANTNGEESLLSIEILESDNLSAMAASQQQELLGEERDPNSVNTNNSDVDYTTEAIKQQLVTGKQQPQEAASFASTLSRTDPGASSATTSWMAQFGSASVARMLLETGDVTDPSLAQTAGDAVEKYCVVRTARRRIRRFLKERDSLWANTDEHGTSSTRSELESLAAEDMADSPAASLLLSYAEQQQRRTKPNPAEDDEDQVLDYASESSPSYGFGDVLAVLRDYGLTGNDLCVLLTHSPNLALRVPRSSFRQTGKTDQAETLEETLERSFKGLLMTQLGLRRYDARKVLRTCPGLLSVRGSKAAVEVMTIMCKLNVSEKSLARDKNHLPVLLSRSPAGLFRLVAFLSSTAIRMPLEQIGPLLRRKPGRELMDMLLPVPNTSYSKAIATNTQAATAAASNATTTAFDTASEETAASTTTLEDDAEAWSRTRVERKERIERAYAGMTRTALILKAQIGTQDLSKVVSAYPHVLLLDAEKQIMPVARYLMGGLGIWQNDLSGVLQLYPRLLGSRIEDLERIVSYMLTLGIDEDDLAGIFRAFPGLFAISVTNMKDVVSYLESIGVEEVGPFVAKLPPILGYSVEKELKPKWEFLKTVTLQPEFELREFPAYFSYPFERVIKTRFNYLAYKGISIRFVSMRIDTILRFGDVDFATKVALDDDYGRAFFQFANQRSGSPAADKKTVAGAAARPRKKAQRHRRNSYAKNRHSRRYATPEAAPSKSAAQAKRDEAKAALAAAQRLSEDIDNATNLAELNRLYREAMPLRNRSLGNSLPSISSPSRPKRKRRPSRKPQPQTQQRQKPRRRSRSNNNNNKQQGGGDIFPCPA